MTTKTLTDYPTLETTWKGQTVTVYGNNDPDGVVRTNITVDEASLFSRFPRTISLGRGTWRNGSFDFNTAVCTAAELDALAADLRANGWPS